MPQAYRGVHAPLDAINRAWTREKSIRHRHASTLHLRWARRPLAACRAVLFAQFVDDPSAWPEEFPTEEGQKQERARLHAVIAEMVPWEVAKRRADPEQGTVRVSCGTLDWTPRQSATSPSGDVFILLPN